MGKTQRDKGQRGEREAAAALQSLGIDAQRGRQYSGSADSPDVRSALSGVHIEVKRTERLRLYDALTQADNDAGEDARPIVLHRRNRQKWVAIVYLDDLLNIAECVHQHTAGRLTNA